MDRDRVFVITVPCKPLFARLTHRKVEDWTKKCVVGHGIS
jgi:hypothetical protein